jgi:hypothetical protein
MTRRASLAAAISMLFVFVAGCGTEPAPPPGEPPEHFWQDPAGPTIKRFVWSYENRQRTDYENLFTEDFTFEFSIAADPDLAQKYANGWFKLDETRSAEHLFEGFTDQLAGYLPPASSIGLTLAQPISAGDTEGRDSTKFRVLATRVDGIIVIPPTGSQVEETSYHIKDNFLRLYLVRGDAAVDSNGNPTIPPYFLADSTLWFIYRWVDETAATPKPSVAAVPVDSMTWSALKARYRGDVHFQGRMP